MVDKIDKDFCLDEDEEIDKDFKNMLNFDEANKPQEDYDLENDNEKNDEQECDYNDEFIVRLFGLDDSGKSTIVMNLINPKEGNVAEITEDFNVEDYIYKNCKISFWDLAGRKDYRECWSNYFNSSDAFIYVIDISNQNRIDEAKKVFNSVILSVKENLELPMLIYANKSDKLSKTIKPEEVIKLLGLPEKSENIHAQVCSAKKFTGLKEGFEWLFSKLKVN